MYWTFLTPEQCDVMGHSVQGWFAQPSEMVASQVVTDLIRLTVDDLVKYAFRYAYHWYQAHDTAASFAAVCGEELTALVEHNATATREVLQETMTWLRETKQEGTRWDLDSLLQRCADQLAATLVFSHLPLCGRPESVWGPLLERVIERVLLHRTVPAERMQTCIIMLLSWAQHYAYQGRGQAVRFFTKALHRHDSHQSLQAAPDSHEVINISLETQDSRRPTPPALQAMSTEEEYTSQLSQLSPSKERPEAVWKLLRELLPPDEALVLWILSRLKEDRHLSYPEMVREQQIDRVLDAWGQLITDDDLPSGITWEAVQHVFHALAARTKKRPGILTADTLRQCYTRRSRTLIHRARRVLLALLLAQHPWQGYPALAWSLCTLMTQRT